MPGVPAPGQPTGPNLTPGQPQPMPEGPPEDQPVLAIPALGDASLFDIPTDPDSTSPPLTGTAAFAVITLATPGIWQPVKLTEGQRSSNARMAIIRSRQ